MGLIGMNVLIVGSGGREHALAWKISQSPLVDNLYCAPGNAGIAGICECVDVNIEDSEAVLGLVQRKRIDLTVVGPEAPLMVGLVDLLEENGFMAFGPTKEAALLEGSKSFAKRLMARYDIPTADFEIFDDPDRAKRYVAERGCPVVIKADGLAGGKGAIVAEDRETAERGIVALMEEKVFGEAGSRIVIEEMLEGKEISVMAFSDGESVLPMVASQDHKRAYEGDRGPNTGGMGAYSPVPWYDGDVENDVLKNILEPAVRGLKELGRPYKGVLYAGLMLTSEGPKVLEFNARFGDPETQVVLPRMDADLVRVMVACCTGRLAEVDLGWNERAAVCVVLASEGYPGSYEKGKLISGLDEAGRIPGVILFHAGTRGTEAGLVTSGGRVLGVTAMGNGIEEAANTCYEAIRLIKFEGMRYRRDIAGQVLRGK